MPTIHNKNLNTMLSSLRASAKKRNIPFKLTLTDLMNVSFPLTCPILNIKLEFSKGKPSPNSYSVDRIDSSKGYTSDNITIISYRANKLKNDASLIELKQIVNYYQLIEEQSDDS